VHKIVTVKVWCESEEVWDNTLEDMNELISMLSNLTRNAEIIKITEGE
jgi:hypothetical protein